MEISDRTVQTDKSVHRYTFVLLFKDTVPDFVTEVLECPGNDIDAMKELLVRRPHLRTDTKFHRAVVIKDNDSTMTYTRGLFLWLAGTVENPNDPDWMG